LHLYFVLYPQKREKTLISPKKRRINNGNKRET
jgi:hypothetical protein